MEPSVPQFVFSTHVTFPVKVPLKITAGRPSVPLPVIWKVLPELLNVAPVVRLPEISEPVVNATLPHGTAVEQVPSPRPITEVRFEPERVRPALLPAKVPPVLPKSTLPAKAAAGKASITIRFITNPPTAKPNLVSRRLQVSPGEAGVCPALLQEHPGCQTSKKCNLLI